LSFQVVSRNDEVYYNSFSQTVNSFFKFYFTMLIFLETIDKFGLLVVDYMRGLQAVDRGVLQIKVKPQNEKSPANFARLKKGTTNQAGEKASRQPE